MKRLDRRMNRTNLVNRWVMLSALVYACAFGMPAICFWCVFIYLIPVYYFVLTAHQTTVWGYAIQGFWWGGIFFLLHMYALIAMLAQHATVAGAIIVSMLLIAYSATISACWFAAAGITARAVRSPGARLTVWVLMTSFFIEWVDTFFFRLICLPRGYVFAYPLVPLAHYEPLIGLVRTCTQPMLVFCLCASSACIAYVLAEKRNKIMAVTAAFLLLVPFIAGFIGQAKQMPGDDRNLLVYIQPPSYSKDMMNVSCVELACSINEQLSRAVRLFPNAHCFLFPESTFPFPLDMHQEVRQLWADNALFNAQAITIIMPSHHSHGNARKNTIFCLTGCRIIQTYDKNTYLPFAEYMPWPWRNSSFFSHFLLKDKKAFHKTESVREPIRLTKWLSVCPYICSDLFFAYPQVEDRASCILWLVNDSWFRCAYFRHLMFLFAKLQAAVYSRPILYCDHERGVFIEPSGKCGYLPSVMIPNCVN